MSISKVEVLAGAEDTGLMLFAILTNIEGSPVLG
jgi:hypothetical protein